MLWTKEKDKKKYLNFNETKCIIFFIFFFIDNGSSGMQCNLFMSVN